MPRKNPSNLKLAFIPESTLSASAVSNPVAYIANWNSIADVKFLAELLNNSIKVRYSEIPFETSGRRFNAGSLIITRNGNSAINGGFEKTVNEIAKKSGISLFAIPTAFMDKGADLGSSKVRFIKKPRVSCCRWRVCFFTLFRGDMALF
jgi:hypothetical protein